MPTDLKLGTDSGSYTGPGNLVQTGGVLTITGSDSNSGELGRSLVVGEYPSETSSYTLSPAAHSTCCTA